MVGVDGFIGADGNLKDFYGILGIDSGASPEDIKRAFRSKAMEQHPDKHNENPEKYASANEAMKQILEAWAVLGNKERKQKYDSVYTVRQGAQAGSRKQNDRPSGNRAPGYEAPQTGASPTSAQDFEAWARTWEETIRQSVGDGPGFEEVWREFYDAITDPGFVEAWSIFNRVNSGGTGSSKRNSRAYASTGQSVYDNVRTVKAKVGFDGLNLGFSDDGKVHIHGKRFQKGRCDNGVLEIDSLEGRLLLPKDVQGIRVEVDGRYGGNISGDLAHSGEIILPSSSMTNVRINLRSPLEILVERTSDYNTGTVEAVHMVYEGDGRSIPVAEKPIGTLKVKVTGSGNAKITYMRETK